MHRLVDCVRVRAGFVYVVVFVHRHRNCTHPFQKEMALIGQMFHIGVVAQEGRARAQALHWSWSWSWSRKHFPTIRTQCFWFYPSRKKGCPRTRRVDDGGGVGGDCDKKRVVVFSY